MANLYTKGALVRISAAFTNTAGSAFDPEGTITGKFENPSGNETAYVYGVDGELVKDSTGNYHFDISITAIGTWHYRFEATGAGQSADEALFFVQQSVF